MLRRLRTLFALLAVIELVVLGLAAPAAAATYYVDSQAGSNANSGTSRSAAWASLPTAGASAAGWKKLQPGDSILIRRGSTFHAPLSVKTDWYATTASNANPIKVTPDPNWGSGPVVWDGAGILILYVPGFHLDGLQRAGIVVQNPPGHGVEVYGQSSSQKLRDLRLANLRVYRANGRHICIQKVDNFLLEGVDVDGGYLLNGASGICLGEDGDRGCSNGQLLNCTAACLGPPDYRQGAGTNNYQGFWIVNSRNIYLDGCDSFDNSGRGYDTGGVGSGFVALSDNITFYRCRAFANRNDGFGSSGEDYPESNPSRHYYYYCLSYNNGNGGWQIYEGPSAYLYNCISDSNGTGLRIWGAPAGFFKSGRKTHIYIYNCVLSRPRATAGDNYVGTLFIGWCNDLDLHSDHNFYVQGASPYAVCWGYFNPGPDVRYRYNSTEAPGGRRKWFADHGQDEHSLCSVDGRLPRFINQDGANYHLGANSDCIDAGTTVGLSQDFERNTVPQGAGVDIGAFELLTGAAQPPPAPTGLRAMPE